MYCNCARPFRNCLVDVFAVTEHLIQTDASTNAGTHYVDQAEWPLEAASPVSARAGDVLVFSYLLVHGSYTNTSDR